MTDPFYISLFTEIADNTGRSAAVDEEAIGLYRDMVKELKVANAENKKSASQKIKDILNLSGIVKNIKKFDKSAIDSGNRFINFMNRFDTEVLSKINTEKMETFGKNMKTFADGLFSFSWKMALAAPLLVLAMPAMWLTKKLLPSFFDAMAEIKPLSDEQMKGIKGLKDIGFGILVFAGSMALASLMTVPIVKNIAGITAVIALAVITTLAFGLIGKGAKGAKDGGEALIWIGAGLFVFAGSLALSSLFIDSINYHSVGKLLIAAGLSSLLFGIVGLAIEEIQDGSAAIAVMGLSLGFFGLMTMLTSKMVEKVDWTKMAGMGLLMAGLAFVFFIAGEEVANIAWGALAFGLIGGALWVVGFGIANIFEQIGGDDGWEKLGKLGTAIGGLGLVFAGAGLLSAPIALGAIAFGLVGGALWALGKGMNSAFQGDSVEKTLEKADAFKTIIKNLTGAFSQVSLVDAVKLPIKALAVGAIGLSLIPLGKGIGEWSKVSDVWDEDQTQKLSFTISSLTDVYSNTQFADIQQGIDSTDKMSNNLVRLAKGITAWKDMQLGEEDMKVVAGNISMVLNTIPSIFADIGKRDRMGKADPKDSLWGSLFGADLSRGDIDLGIDSTMKMGSNLEKLSKGIMAWKDMKLSPEELKVVAENISSVLNVIPEVFAQIGQRDRLGKADPSASMWGSLFGSDLSKGDIELGISSTMDIGENLKKLSDGIMAWAPGGKLALDKAQLKNVVDNIDSVLNTLPDAFARIGKKDRDTTQGKWFWSHGDVDEGIKLAGKMQGPLNSMSKLMEAFIKLEGGVTMESIGKDFAAGMGHISGGFALMVTKFKDEDIKRLEKMVDPMSKMAKVMKDVSSSMKEQVEWLSKMDKTYIDNLAVWANALSTLSEIDSQKLSENSKLGTENRALPSESQASAFARQIGSKQETQAAPAAANNQANLEAMFAQLVEEMQGLTAAFQKNTQAVEGIKTQLMGTIRTKEVHFV